MNTKDIHWALIHSEHKDQWVTDRQIAKLIEKDITWTKQELKKLYAGQVMLCKKEGKHIFWKNV